MAKEKDVAVKSITTEEAEKLGPEEIVINNARILVHAELEEAKKLIATAFEYIEGLINVEDTDFRTDPKAVVGMQLQLAALSLAAEYWVEKMRKGRIKVYSPAEMPKA